MAHAYDMACYKPLKGYWSRDKTANGKRKVVFSTTAGYADRPIDIPCGQCTGCRLERSRQWAVRCIHEASLYKENCFITLTYNNDNLPQDGSLDIDHFQRFMKRFRKKYKHKKIRFFHCGEYGEKTRRPHYHAIIFNHDFHDKLIHSQRDGIPLYTSKILEELWPYGFNTIGDVTFESAAYVARYILKKITGEQAHDHYRVLDSSTGELVSIRPEYTTMSRRPGIGKGWFEKYSADVYPKDFLTVRGVKVKPPKFYDSLLEQTHIEQHEKIKTKRIIDAKKNRKDNTPERLSVREKVKQIQIKSLKRKLEDEL